MAHIDINRRAKPPFVRVTADDGTQVEWPLDQFEADPAACVAATGNGITPPVPEPTAEEKLAVAEKELAGLREALIAKGIISKAEIDAQKAVAAEDVALEVTQP